MARSSRTGQARIVDGRSVEEWARTVGEAPKGPTAAADRRRAVAALGSVLLPGASQDSAAVLAATRALGDAVLDPDTLTAGSALDALRDAPILPDAASARVVRLMTAGPVTLRLRAIALASHIAPSEQSAAARALVPEVEDRDTALQAVAIHEVARLLPLLETADRWALLPVVVRAATSPSDEVRATGLEAYATFADATFAEPTTTPPVAALAPGLDGGSVWAVAGPALAAPSAEVRAAAAAALGDFVQSGAFATPRTAAQAVTALARMLTDPDADVRREAARALGAFGASAKSAVDAMRARLADPSPGVQAAAREALIRVGAPR